MGKPAGLAQEQLRALGRLKRLAEVAPFYLAGRTAIAFHLGHRRSLDLDLFSHSDDVDLSRVRRSLSRLRNVAVIAETDAALTMRLDGEPIDFVKYPYPLLEPAVRGPVGFPVAGALDLTVMKPAAVARRGIRRDFWDLYVLITERVPIDVAARAYVRRYGVGESDLYQVARALTYFADAEKDSAYPAGLSRQRWNVIKRFFVAEAPKLLGA